MKMYIFSGEIDDLKMLITLTELKKDDIDKLDEFDDTYTELQVYINDKRYLDIKTDDTYDEAYNTLNGVICDILSYRKKVLDREVRRGRATAEDYNERKRIDYLIDRDDDDEWYYNKSEKFYNSMKKTVVEI